MDQPKSSLSRVAHPQEYQIFVSHLVQQVTTYQFEIPQSQDQTSAVLLRVKAVNSGVAALFTSFYVVQEGNTEGVDLSSYFVPAEGIPQVFEILLPWNSEAQSTISIRIQANGQALPPT